MYKQIAYIIIFLIFGGILFFSFLINQRLETEEPTLLYEEIPVTEEDRINIIFKEELHLKN